MALFGSSSPTAQASKTGTSPHIKDTNLQTFAADVHDGVGTDEWEVVSALGHPRTIHDLCRATSLGRGHRSALAVLALAGPDGAILASV